MKINRVRPENRKNSNIKNNLFLNIYYFLVFYRYIIFIIIGLALSAFVILFFADWVAPKTMKNIDKKTTLQIFDQLQEANQHHEAIIIMEAKGDILKDDPNEIVYKSKLADSYIHVGDYSKAEKVLLDVWNKLPEYLKSEKFSDMKDKERLSSFLMFGLSRTIYQFYEKIGDKKNQIKYFNIYKHYYDKSEVDIDSLTIALYNSKTWFQKKEAFNSKELIEYDSIVVSYELDQATAVSHMEAFVDKILNRKEYSPAYKVKCLNKLIKWQLDANNLMGAYERIEQAVSQVKLMKMTGEYIGLGELSDYCYAVHDIEMSKSLYRRYQNYLDENFKENDYEYIANYVRKFRYLEEDKQWDKLTTEVIDYCKGMRNQIAKNIPTMTEEQREYFSKQFDFAYRYAFELLQKHPTDKLAATCFDNVTFKSGLLLRSNVALKHSIENLNDPHLTALYTELMDCQKELIFQEVINKHFFSQQTKLRNKINEIEKELALASTDFKNKNNIEEKTCSNIGERLSKSEALVEFIEQDGHLFALVLKHDKDVEYVPIGEVKDIENKLQRNIYEIYHDKEFTHYLYANVGKLINNCSTVYYMPVGLFNQIAIGTLYSGNNTYLCDAKDWKLLSNPSVIVNEESPISLSFATNMVTLWGGIDYGGNANFSVADTVKRASIKRGETLRNLRYAYQEVLDISSMFNENNIRNILYTNHEATEGAFKKRSGAKDYIVHISTHGFFKDNMNESNQMLQSGLFFAGANKYWSNDTLDIIKGQEDGILYSDEISKMNLSGCYLAVLSACETGLGFDESSEGVYGLQRAFKLAGTNLILMSLWEVDDRATNMLMTEFYRDLITYNDADKALKEAQKKVRDYYPSPEDWGGFVLLH